jgi:hypothetical protein
MYYWVHEYITDTHVCEKCKFTLFVDFVALREMAYQPVALILDVKSSFKLTSWFWSYDIESG